MSIISDIKEFTSEISEVRNIEENRGFIYWFLSEMEDYSEEEVEIIITDRPGDQGADAIYYDEENLILKVYQFKYSENDNYACDGYTQLMNAIKHRSDIQTYLRAADKLELYLVTICDNHDILTQRQKSCKKSIKSYLTRQGISVEVEFELFDPKRFSHFFEKIYGVDLKLDFKQKICQDGDVFYGLVNANLFKEHIDKEELLAFNIRKFLGIRKGSVNYKIFESLISDETNEKFWYLNNGIVCLCTHSNVSEKNKSYKIYESIKELRVEGLLPSDYEEKFGLIENPMEDGVYSYQFKNLTIVNGAQTVNTICKYLETNPVDQDVPIWVLCKIVTVPDDSNIEEAIQITKASNSQNPANTRDLRAVDISHKRISRWLYESYNMQYIFRRGQKKERNIVAVDMKELSQAYTAFTIERPDISFGNVGKIFSDSENYYSNVFPEEDIQNMMQSGDIEEKNEFLINRLVPYFMLKQIRIEVDRKVKEIINASGDDTQSKNASQWKSLTYHILWIYKRLLEIKEFNISFVFEDRIYERIINGTIDDIFDTLYDELVGDPNISKLLKSDNFKNTILVEKSFLSKSRIIKVLRQLEILKATIEDR